ncbi:MAG: DUF962 domain-containing protein [Flavobacteriales bacterium]|nr:DUF962 domain-containing protein [Flavobacteriales bacterium]
MPTMQEWLDAYGESHTNPTNKLFHWLCVPTIFVTLLGLLSLIPFSIPALEGTEWEPYIHFGTVLIIVGIVFYVRLSTVMTLGMLAVSALSLYMVKLVNSSFAENAWMVFLGGFAIAWVGQFIGHKIEGAKPSFLDDLKFLLIGPAWLLSFIFRKLGISY